MSKAKTAKLFRNGRSQAVRLPREFRFEGDEVRIRQLGAGVLLEPRITDVREWFAQLDRVKSSFMKKEPDSSRALLTARSSIELPSRYECLHCSHQWQTSRSAAQT